MGGPLSEGTLTSRSCVPWHGWTYCVDTGLMQGGHSVSAYDGGRDDVLVSWLKTIG
jgi:nitrite reductase/ring-hydroxylating ferredoxin subunit